MKAQTSVLVSDFPVSVNAPRLHEVTQYLTVETSSHNPKLPLTVTKVPLEEVEGFRKTVVARYLKQISKGFIQRALAKFKTETVKPVSDLEFIGFLTKTTYAKSLCAEISIEDRELFSLSSGDKQVYYKFDFRHIAELTPLPGLYLPPNVALLKKDPKGELNAEAIWINGVVLRANDGDAWELAKYFVLSTGISDLMFAEHPMVHFPMDAVNALTRSIFPKDHIVFKLIYPHTHLQLPLNYGVLYQQRSVLFNKQKEIYTPYAHQCEKEVFQLLAKRYQGELKHGNGTNPFSYPMQERTEHTDYDRFLNVYYRVIYDFVRQALEGVETNDPYVDQWAMEISSRINGFPSEVTIWEGDKLVRAVTGFIWNCGIVHSVDHHCAGELPVDKVPYRMRVAPPADKDVKLDRKQIMIKSDFSRQRLAIDMFVSDHAVTKFIDVDYQFDTPELQALSCAFKRNLQTADENLSVERLMRLDEFAASIQY